MHGVYLINKMMFLNREIDHHRYFSLCFGESCYFDREREHSSRSQPSDDGHFLWFMCVSASELGWCVVCCVVCVLLCVHVKFSMNGMLWESVCVHSLVSFEVFCLGESDLWTVWCDMCGSCVSCNTDVVQRDQRVEFLLEWVWLTVKLPRCRCKIA